MFNRSVYIEINGDINKYIARAENLGYTRFETSGNKYIILWSSEHSIEPHKNYCLVKVPNPYFTTPISEKEFFGETMLKKIDLEILSVLVSLVCEKLDSFSAYDITSILRSRLKDFNIDHEEVKTFVKNYVTGNLLTPTDNGTYITYSKNNFKTKPSINIATNISTVFDPAVHSIKPTAKKSTETKLDKLLKEKNSSVTLNMSKILPLQSEGRVNITELIKAHFPKDRFVYVKRDKNANKVIISNVAQADTTQVLIGEEVRIRTGFYGSNNVKVNFLKNAVEVTPY